MAKIPVYDISGAKKTDVTASDKLFAAPVREDLLHRAVVRQLWNARTNVAHVKTRAEVSATRKKAFKQKGTGNARRGSLTTNLLRGGGAAHGPRAVRNFTKNMPASERKQVIYASLSARTEKSLVLDLGEVKEPKTSIVAKVLPKLPEGKKTLFVISAPKDKNELKSVRNIADTRFVYAQYVNPVDFLWSDRVIFVNNALEAVETIFNPKK